MKRLRLLRRFFSPALCDEESSPSPLPSPPPLQPDSSAPPSPFPAPCAKYNSFLQRLQWATRADRCNSQPECLFSGLRVTGECVARPDNTPPPSSATLSDIAAPASNNSSVTNTNTNSNNNSSPSQTQTQPQPPQPPDFPSVQQLVNEQLTSSAVTTLKDSRSHAETLAKQLIIAHLQQPQHKAEFGKVLDYLFSVERVREPTRALIYWSLRQPACVVSVHSQAAWWTRYFLKPTFATVSGDSPVVTTGQGFAFTQLQLTSLITWWLSTQGPGGREGIDGTEGKEGKGGKGREGDGGSVVTPLLDWGLRQPVVVDGIADIVAQALPYCRPFWLDCAKTGLRDALLSPPLKAAARDGLMLYLKNAGGGLGTGASVDKGTDSGSGGVGVKASKPPGATAAATASVGTSNDTS